MSDTVSYPIRMTSELDASVVKVSELLQISKQDTLRLCLRIGLEDLRVVDYNLPGIIVQKANRRRSLGGLAMGPTMVSVPQPSDAVSHGLNEGTVEYKVPVSPELKALHELGEAAAKATKKLRGKPQGGAKPGV